MIAVSIGAEHDTQRRWIRDVASAASGADALPGSGMRIT